jgi:hypothetical protein
MAEDKLTDRELVDEMTRRACETQEQAGMIRHESIARPWAQDLVKSVREGDAIHETPPAPRPAPQPDKPAATLGKPGAGATPNALMQARLNAQKARRQFIKRKLRACTGLSAHFQRKMDFLETVPAYEARIRQVILEDIVLLESPDAERIVRRLNLILEDSIREFGPLT